MADPEAPVPPADPLYINQHEDAIVTKLKALSVLNSVELADKKVGLASMPQYPAAYVSYVDDALKQDQPRPVYDRFFQIYVLIRNLGGQAQAKDASTGVLGEIDKALSGSKLGFSNIGPLVRTRTVHNGYEDGVLGFIMQYRCKFYRELPTAT